MRFRCLAFLTLCGSVGCNNSRPVDCYKIAPSDCGKYSQCRTIAAGRLDDQCVELFSPVGCWPVDVPGCQLEFNMRDPTGQCWGMGECLVPPGWQEDGSCYGSLEVIYNACYPRDAGTAVDSGIAGGGDTGGD